MLVLRLLSRIWMVIIGIVALVLTLGLAVRLVAPFSPWVERPMVTAITPSDGKTDVVPQSAITFAFDQPVNQQSVEHALQIVPPTDGEIVWDDQRSLTFEPRVGLTPNITYTVRLDDQAVGLWGQPISGTRQIEFRTAQIPNVVAAFPQDETVTTDTSMALFFSQPMVAPSQIGVAVAVPQLTITPAVAYEARWSDVNVLLIRPTAPLAAATQYTASLTVNLADLRGTPIDAPFAWNWTTDWPEVVSANPSSTQRRIAPLQPFELTLSAPLDIDLLRASLQISPTTAGTLQASPTVSGTQLVTFTPQNAWTPNSTYTVTLRRQTAIDSSPTDETWQFAVAPQPTLTGRFPGQGQILPDKQAIRLLFNTPMDIESLRSGLSLDPPVVEIPISVSDTEVRLQPELRPSTAYTLSIAADTRDVNGLPLGTDYQVRLLTAPAEPALDFPDAAQHIVTLPVSQTAALLLDHVNVSALNLSLYKLDEVTLLRTLTFSSSDWRSFNPERYNQALQRKWRIPLDDPADEMTRSDVPISVIANQPLAPGAYYLRAQTPEVPRADLLLLVSPIKLALIQNDAQVLVWATDTLTNEPVSDLSLSVYVNDSVVYRGRTDKDGLLQINHRRQSSDPYLVIADANKPAVVRSDWQIPLPQAAGPQQTSRYRTVLFADKSVYAPGETLSLAGFTRRLALDGTLTYPLSGADCRLQLVQNTTARRQALQQNDCLVNAATGTITTSAQLVDDLPLGEYTLQATVGDSVTRLPLRIETPNDLLDVVVEATTDAGIVVAVRGANQPIAGAVVDWTLRLNPQPLPTARDGFVFTNLTPALSMIQRGSGTTDANGTLVVPLPDTATLTQTLAFETELAVYEPGGMMSKTSTNGLRYPSSPRVGIRLPSRVVFIDENPLVDLIAVDAANQPASNTQIQVEVFREEATASSAPLLVRQVTTDAAGQAQVALTPLNPGAYRISARVGVMESSATLWATGSGYTGWNNAAQQVTLVPDRAVYQPGDTARLLVTTPYEQANAVLMLERGDALDAEVRSLQPSRLITIPITADMAPNTVVNILVASGSELRTGSTELQVVTAAAPLTMTLAIDAPTMQPEATATITVTTRNNRRGVAANLLVTIAPDYPLAPTPALTETLNSVYPTGLRTTRISAAYVAEAALAAPLVVSAERPQTTERLLLAMPMVTDVDGNRVAQVPLPATPGRWRITAYASAGVDRVGQASTLVTTEMPLVLTPLAPATLHLGDRADVGLTIRNTSAVTQSAHVQFTARGVAVAGDQAPTRQIELAPAGETRLLWTVSSANVTSATLRFRVQPTNAPPITEQTAIRVAALAEQPTQQQTVAATKPISLTLPAAQSSTEPPLQLAFAPTVRAAVADAAITLAAQPDRSSEQEASLLMLSAALFERAPTAEQAQWRTLVEQSLDTFDTTRNSDGGWGWWPGQPTALFTTAYVLEAQASARTALGLAQTPRLRTLALLEQLAENSDPNVQAYVQYVLRMNNAADATAARALVSAELQPDGLAYLALALPERSADEPLARLLETVQSLDAADGTNGSDLQAYWSTEGFAPLARSDVSTTAVAVHALRKLRPNSAFRGAAEQFLRSQWGITGWPTSFDSARVAVALLSSERPVTQTLQIRLNGDPLPGITTPVTDVQRLSTRRFTAANALQVTSNGSATPFLVSYRARANTGANAEIATLSDATIQQDYFDPVRGVLLDPATLRPGQLVEVRLTVVSRQPFFHADLVAEPPANFDVIAATPAVPFIHVEQRDTRLVFAAVDMSAGIHMQSYTARVAAAGVFAAPPPRLVAAFTPETTVTARQTPSVIAR